jgi:hemerythrin-like domain-containing protein
MSDAIDALMEQHAEVTALFMKIDKAADPVLRSQIFRTIDSHLRTHSIIEEKIFYPAFKERARTREQAAEVDEALQEHGNVESVLEQLERTDPGSNEYKARLASLKALVLQHVVEEETGMLKQARKLFSTAELEALGLHMTQYAAIASPVYEMAGPSV